MMKYMVIGGAGFIGSHLVKSLLNEVAENNVTVFDNFSSGKMWHLDEVKTDKNVNIIKGDVKELNALEEAMKEMNVVYHFASNPDIAKAVTQPDIDFWEGTYLTNNVLEAMRLNDVRKLIYASGSGVYGDVKFVDIEEDYSPMLPISTYGASKLSGEALICSYCHMFSLSACAFRFANVVGPNQTHGVGYDFVKKLTATPEELQILGDGTQNKHYIYITDVVNAMTLLEKRGPMGFSYYNVAPLDSITVTEIAEIVVDIMGLNNVRFNYTGGDRGWKGDVPMVRLSSEKIRNIGWSNRFTSKEAIAESVKRIYEDVKSGKV